MSEPRRSTRARAREDAAPPAPETPKEAPKETAVKSTKSALKRKRTSIAVKVSIPSTPAPEAATTRLARERMAEHPAERCAGGFF
ncbi:predicted protein [Plenodomus lingam JN3]|uniref:Predicted protein n=1 Tax=Leptosphaeria maculans (strain JN3 / isolate v23.1.3 / race Av1-4-5-6-7-8) TaxID=985895 RepID=E4ZTH1_LEPMJ|nr:predicted protein [Plenodomus lingam JN3]CBX94827.1 predicted protein [Plenodomus lingam JN3]